MELTVGEALKRGVEAHKAGRLQEAEVFYTTILNDQPNHADANHNMGVLATGVGKLEESLPFFKTASGANPNIVQFWLSYINALMNLGRITDAQAVFDQAKSKGANGKAIDQLEKQIATQGQKIDETNIAGKEGSNYSKSNILDTMKLDKALRLAKRKYKHGHVEEANNIYQQILQKFPKNKNALIAVKSLFGGARVVLQDPSKEQLQSIVNLYTRGQLRQALSESSQMLERFPNSVLLYNIAGAANVGLMHFDAAIDSYKQALKINPEYAEAYYNIGIALGEKGDADAAIDSYKQALKINPDYADAYNNMGIALNEKGDVTQAISSYNKALVIKPGYAEAFNNMGIALGNQGDLVSAINSYKKALKIKPDYAEAYNNIGNALNDMDDQEGAVDSYSLALKINSNYREAQTNLVTLLTSYTPQKESSNLIVRVNSGIRKIGLKSDASNIISDAEAVEFFSTSSNYMASHGLKIRTDLSQSYRNNSVDLNCKRHILIFNTYDVIPEFCFGCYKVQTEPRSIIELIKLFLIFDELELHARNTRKCMVELRPEIPGFYKGLIYCSGLKQANQVAESLDMLVKQRIGPGLSSTVKRGCSEYPIAFPDYKEINNSGPQLMNYNEAWKVVEEEHDIKHPMSPKENIRPSISGLRLSDVLIMRKWIDYANGIGDSSAKLINQSPVYYQGTYDLAQARLDTFHFSH